MSRENYNLVKYIVILKALLFDFGGTLDSDGRTWADRFLPLYREALPSVPEEALRRAFYDSDDALPARHALAGLDLERTVALQVDDVLRGLSRSDGAVSRRITDAFVSEARRHLRRNRPLLERLRRSYRLGVVSNFYGNLEGLLAAEGLGGLFEAVADSAVVGATKPDAPIFRHALAALGVAPAEAMMVGDSTPRDMRGAEALGMPHALISSGQPCCPEAIVLGSLTELERALAGAGAPR